MGARPWHNSLGIAAVLIWTGFIGFPILLFHATDRAVLIGDHIHAAVLFVASQGLVFWLAARSTAPDRWASYRRPPSVARVASGPEPIWEAELLEYRPDDRRQPVPAGPLDDDLAQPVAPLTIANYFASSTIRYVLIEPGGARYDLLPGQSLQITTNDTATAVRFRLVETEQSTQVFVEGLGLTAVEARLERNYKSAVEPPSTRRGLAEGAR